MLSRPTEWFFQLFRYISKNFFCHPATIRSASVPPYCNIFTENELVVAKGCGEVHVPGHIFLICTFLHVNLKNYSF